jgi:hypothetical protein
VILFRFGSNRLRTPQEEYNGAGGLKGEGRWHIMGERCVHRLLEKWGGSFRAWWPDKNGKGLPYDGRGGAGECNWRAHLQTLIENVM